MEWISQDLRQHVDLTVGRLHAIALFRLADTRYAWYVRAHHICIDGYSGMLWAHRVADVYTAFVNGDNPSPSPFASLCALLSEEESYRSSEQVRRDRASWIAEMEGAPDAATLASRKAAPSVRCIRVQIELSPKTEAHLRQLAQESGVEISSLLFAFVAVYLARMEGMGEVVVGLPVTGRLTDWSGEQLWRAYIQLTEAEEAFRLYKSDLVMRPVWHQKERRVQAHILVCFLAYVLWKTLSLWCQRAQPGWASRVCWRPTSAPRQRRNTGPPSR
ncbi:condensation domain-containing protein [Acidicapsa acidisoli]|uniref:condensation domain-containing protein n=1 Tax=Acidicapsa acidisoli TaxID=1615681 RepID=UPI0021E06976|nr:condensation domain-containing protein [Acidicapsa acidisoli]